MIELFDFTNCQLSNRNLQYAGRAGEKRGIIFNNEYWFLKFPKNTIGMSKVSGLSYVTSPLSEYIGSQIYKELGLNVHETKLGICNDGKRDKVVCACKDFIVDDKNELLIPYTALRNDTNPLVMQRNDENLQSASNINEIIFQLNNNTVLSKIKDAQSRFWKVVIIDIFINNNDRNEDNWGVVKNKKENKYEMSPIYDCGNCFYGKTSDERIEMIMNHHDRLVSSAVNGITSYEDDKEKKISIMEMLEIVKTNANSVLVGTIDTITKHMDNIEKIIMDIPESFKGTSIISKLRKKYYIETLKIRLDLMKKYI